MKEEIEKSVKSAVDKFSLSADEERELKSRAMASDLNSEKLAKSEIISRQIESKIHSKLTEFDFAGTVGLGDIASMICSDLMVDYKVTEHGE